MFVEISEGKNCVVQMNRTSGHNCSNNDGQLFNLLNFLCITLIINKHFNIGISFSGSLKKEIFTSFNEGQEGKRT